MRSNSSNYLFLIVFLIFARCVGDGNDQSNDPAEKSEKWDFCLKEFNKIFEEISLGGIHYSFDTLILGHPPLLIPDFYSDEELEKFEFIKLLSDSVELNLAVSLDSIESRNELYFLGYFGEYLYIDYSTNVHTDLHFLNECGINIFDSNFKGVPLLTTNNYDSRIFGLWELEDSADTTKMNKIVEIRNDETLIPLNGDTLSFYKKGGYLYNTDGDKEILNILSFSRSKMIIVFPDQEAKLYSK